MSLQYVKKKADKRVNNYSYKTKQETINGIDTGVKQILNDKGNVLAEVRYTPRGENFEIRMDNYNIEKGAARKALADLMKEYPDKTFHWEAINQQSLKSYNHFVKEYPELAERVKFIDSSPVTTSIDINRQIPYNSKKGVISETTNNRSSNSRGTGQEVQGTDNTTNRGNISDSEAKLYDEWGIPINTERGNVSENIHNSIRTGETSNNKIKEQGFLGQPIEKVFSNEITYQEADSVIKNEAEKLGGWDYNSLGKDADTLYANLKNFTDDILALEKIYNQGDLVKLQAIAHKTIAGQRVLSDLQQKLLKINPEDIAASKEILEAIGKVSDYISNAASAFGGGLKSQAASKKLRGLFELTTIISNSNF